MSAQDSDNYCWCTEPENVLGQGATGMVYRGYHKTTCELVAIKSFNAKSFKRAPAVQAREFQLTLRLSHRNIVRLLAAETESGTGNKILVTELCEGGSLYDFISKPENTFGLEDAEFLRVLEDVTAGLKYLRHEGIVHRDLKPGNILRHIAKDGSSVYKLTDFGTARELEDDGLFMSICGTEEYLHPEMYAAVVNRSLRTPFGAHVDLWSFGVTLYQAAAGRLPFLPYGGRQNREIMFEMVSKKDSGYISGVQHTRGGPIDWQKDLPEACLLSKHLRSIVVTLIRGVMETKKERAWTYKHLFKEVEDIVHLGPVPVFCTLSCTLHKFYLHKSSKLSHLQKISSQFTDIPAEKQFFILNQKPLTELVKPEDHISKYPGLSEGTIIIVSTEEVERFPPPGKEVTLHIPKTEDRVPLKETQEVQLMFATSIYCERCTKEFNTMIKLLSQAENVIRELVLREFYKLEAVFPYVKFIELICLDRSNVAGELFTNIIHLLDPKKGYFTEKLSSMSRDFSQFNSAGTNTDLQQQNITKYMEQYRDRLVEGPLLVPLADYRGCEDKKCCDVAQTCVLTSRRAWEESFSRRRHDPGYSPSQSWMRHVARIRITEELARLKENLENHCYVNVKRVQRHFLAWVSRSWKYLKKVNKLSDEIQKVNRDSESLHFNITKKEEEFIRILVRVAHGIDGSSQHWQMFAEPYIIVPNSDIKQHATNVNVDSTATRQKPSTDTPDSGHKLSKKSGENVKNITGSDGKQLQESLSGLASQTQALHLMLSESTKMLECLEDHICNRPTSAESPSRYTTT